MIYSVLLIIFGILDEDSELLARPGPAGYGESDEIMLLTG